MDLSSDPSQDEARIMERQLYRPGQTPAAPKTTAPATRSFAKPSTPTATKRGSGAAGDKKSSTGKRLILMLLLLGFGYYLLYGTQSQRKRTLIGLGVTAWLFLLGGISYCIFLPDLDSLAKERGAIWEDKNLTIEQKFEKFRAVDKNLTASERRQLWEKGRQERMRRENGDMHKFAHMSPEEQVAYVQKKAKEDEERRQQFRAMFANRGNQGRGSGSRGNGGNGGNGGGNRGGAAGGGNGGAAGGGGAGGGGGGQATANRGGGGPGGGGGGGGGGWGRGGSGADRNQRSRSRLDFSSPESRAGRAYMRGMQQQMGITGGGRGGPGGPPRR